MRARAQSSEEPAILIPAPDGGRLSYRRRGAGPAMLIHNGLLSTELHWRPFIAHYRPTHSVVTWDYRGHGDSPRPAALAQLSIEQHARDGSHVLGASGAGGPAIVCGLSMGVQTALEHARQRPGDVRALILICGTAGHPVNRISRNPVVRQALVWWTRALGLGGRLLQAATGPALRSPLARELTYLTGGAHRTECPREVLDELFEHIASLDVDVAMASVSAYLAHSAWEALPEVRVPTLLIAGGEDQLTPPSISEEMQRRMTGVPGGAELHVIAGHSHLAQVERPDEVHAICDRFLARHGLA